MRVALVHDWLTGMRGGEKVLSCLCELLPQADILTLIHTPGSYDGRIESMRIITSGLNDFPGVRHYYRYLLPLMPLAIERLEAKKYDLIILDIIMEPISGDTFFNRIRLDKGIRTPVLVVTVLHRNELEGFDGLNNVSFLQKPVTEEQLFKKIENVIE